MKGFRAVSWSRGCVWLLALSMVGCADVDDKVDHSFRISNRGDTRIRDLTYTYGVLGPRTARTLGFGGDMVTAPMPIPEVVDVEWTTEADQQVHEAHIPLRSKVSPAQAKGKNISFEIDGATLKVFLLTPVGDFEDHREQLF